MPVQKAVKASDICMNASDLVACQTSQHNGFLHNLNSIGQTKSVGTVYELPSPSPAAEVAVTTLSPG